MHTRGRSATGVKIVETMEVLVKASISTETLPIAGARLVRRPTRAQKCTTARLPRVSSKQWPFKITWHQLAAVHAISSMSTRIIRAGQVSLDTRLECTRQTTLQKLSHSWTRRKLPLEQSMVLTLRRERRPIFLVNGLYFHC